MAEDGYLHPSFAKLHPRLRTPVRAIVVSTAVSSLLALFTLTQLIAVYAWLRSATSILTLIALWRLRKDEKAWRPSFRVPGGPYALALLIIVPIALFAWALANSDSSARIWGPAYLSVGLLAFQLLGRFGSSR
jgi:amino acid transporter